MRFAQFAMLTGISTALLVVGGCDDDDDNDAAVEMPTTTMSIMLSGVEDLGSDAVYEGWLIVDGAPVSSGIFTVDSSGNPVPDTFEVAQSDADAATAFVLTIEPAVGDDPAPADTHLLAGDISGGMATLSTEHGAAIGTDFSTSAGTFFLATPSTASISTDEDQGIWFIDTSSGGPAAGLTLPSLPAGWVYEGWVVLGGSPMSTGTFSSSSAADSDGGGSAAGPDATPPFPGQDYISPALSLIGGTAVISVEPVPDNSPAPFAIKPLTGAIVDAGAGVGQGLSLNLDSVPSGLVTFGDPAPAMKVSN